MAGSHIGSNVDGRLRKQNDRATSANTYAHRFDAASGEIVEVAACHVDKVVDTTAAGDTFIGYYLAGVAANMAPADAMQRASRASAICVSRAGAGVSIPLVSEL